MMLCDNGELYATEEWFFEGFIFSSDSGIDHSGFVHVGAWIDSIYSRKILISWGPKSRTKLVGQSIVAESWERHSRVQTTKTYQVVAECGWEKATHILCFKHSPISLPSTKSTFSQLRIEKCINENSENWKYYHLASWLATKSQGLHIVWWCVSGEAAGEIWNRSLLGMKGLNKIYHCMLYLHSPQTQIWARILKAWLG